MHQVGQCNVKVLYINITLKQVTKAQMVSRCIAILFL
jgi:hypothetical protein